MLHIYISVSKIESNKQQQCSKTLLLPCDYSLKKPVNPVLKYRNVFAHKFISVDCNVNQFVLIFLRPFGKRVKLITLDASFLKEYIAMGTWEKGPALPPLFFVLIARQGASLVSFLHVFGVMLPGIEPPTSRSPEKFVNRQIAVYCKKHSQSQHQSLHNVKISYSNSQHKICIKRSFQ